MLHTFKKEFFFEDKGYKEIDIPLDNLTGADINRIQKQWRAAGNMAVVPVLDAEFCAYCAAAAAKLPLEFFERLSGQEYLRLTQKIADFFLAAD